jgi:hypothetical protein
MKKLEEYEFIKKKIGNPISKYLSVRVFDFSYAKTQSGKGCLLIQDNMGELIKEDEIKAIIKGLTNFVEEYDQEDIDYINWKAEQDKMERIKKSSFKPETKNRSGVVYLLKIKDDDQYKIGVSTKFKKRYDKLSTLMPFELETVNLIKSNDIYNLEESLHNKFEDKRINGEWFELSSKDVKYIKSIEDDIE